MKGVVLLTLLLLALAVQSYLPPLWGAKPPALLLVVLYYALAHRGFAVLPAVFLAGILQDALTGIPMGFSSCTFLATALAVRAVRGPVAPGSAWTCALCGALGALAEAVLMGAALAAVNLLTLPPAALRMRALGLLVWGGLLLPLLCAAGDRLARWVGLTEARA